MPYQTGTFTSASDLRTTLTTFCTTNGWTNSGNLLHKGNSYVELQDDVEGLRVKAGLGKDVSDLLTTPSNYYRGIRTGIWAGATMSFPATYHLIYLTNPDCVFLVVNYNVDRWQHLAFGEVRKFGVYNGGQFASGSNFSFLSSDSTNTGVSTNGSVNSTGVPRSSGVGFMLSGSGNPASPNPEGSSDMYCDLDSQGWRINGVTPGSYFQLERFYGSGHHAQFLNTLNTWNSQTMLCPVYVQTNRNGNFTSFVGDIPHVRYIRVDNLGDGDIISVGGQQWITFPHMKKDSTVVDSGNASNHSSVCGWAIKYDGP